MNRRRIGHWAAIGVTATLSLGGAVWAAALPPAPIKNETWRYAPGELEDALACGGAFDDNSSARCTAWAESQAHHWSVPIVWGGTCPITPPEDVVPEKTLLEWRKVTYEDVSNQCRELKLGPGWDDADPDSTHGQLRILLWAFLVPVGSVLLLVALVISVQDYLRERRWRAGVDLQAAIETDPTDPDADVHADSDVDAVAAGAR